MSDKKRVDKLLIHQKFENKGDKSQHDKHKRDYRICKGVCKNACNRAGYRKGDKAHKRFAVNLELFNLNIVAGFFQFVCHKLLPFELFGGAGAARTDFIAYSRYALNGKA